MTVMALYLPLSSPAISSRSASLAARAAAWRSAAVVLSSSRVVSRRKWACQSRSHVAGGTVARSSSRARCSQASRGRCRRVATALEQARQSRNEAVHGWPGGPDGLFVKSRHAPVAVSSTPSASACSSPAAPAASWPGPASSSIRIFMVARAWLTASVRPWAVTCSASGRAAGSRST